MFRALCAHPQDNCINTTSGMIILCEWPSGMQVDEEQQFLIDLHTGRPLTKSHYTKSCIKLLKPTGHVMHYQFNIQQLYALPTLYLCVLY